MLRQLFPPILQTQEAELICEVCLLLTHPLFRDMPRCLQAILSPPSFDNVPSHLWHQRQLGPHVLSSQSESMHCAQHSPSWNKICFIDTARFKEHNSQTGDSAGLPSVGRLCKDLSKRGGNLPEPPNTKDVCERGSDKNPADTDVLMLRKILPVSSLSLLKISLFPHRHPVCGVSVPGAKHSSCRAAGLGADGLFYCNAEASETAGRSSWDHIFFLLNWGHPSKAVLWPPPLPDPGKRERMNTSGLKGDLLQEGCLLEQAVLPPLSSL